MSMGQDPVPSDRVNVIGRILGDASVLRRVMEVLDHSDRTDLVRC